MAKDKAKVNAYMLMTLPMTETGLMASIMAKAHSYCHQGTNTKVIGKMGREKGKG